MSKNDRPLQIPFDRGEIFVPVLGETNRKDVPFLLYTFQGV
jgi:hypothetical protein